LENDEGNRAFGRARHRPTWEYNIKIDLKVIIEMMCTEFIWSNAASFEYGN
jgi:hypothetical protein